MKEITLFDDQVEFVAKIRRELQQGHKSVLGVASTGFGKTIVSAFIAKQSAANGKRVWFLCHLKNLLTQTSQAFWKLHIQHGLIASGKAPSNQAVQVATIGTLGRRLDKLTPPDVLIVDEAHLSMAKTWVDVIRWAKEAGTIIIGNSATPCRLDNKGLDYLFDTMVEAHPMQWLIDNGRLSEYEIYSTKFKPDLTHVKKRAGDYASGDLEKAMDKPKLIGDAASHWKKYAKGLRTIAYCTTIKHSKHTAEQFNASGIPAAHVDGTTPQTELKEIIKKFADGEYMVLCNVQLMTTGFDLSAQVNRDITIEAAILLRPTQSLALYMQMVGRALRMKDKPAVILDHAGCVMQHGLPDDHREWTLDGKKKGKRAASEEPDLYVQQCKKCYHVFKAGPDKCPKCSEPCQRKTPKMIQVVEGELERIDIERERKRTRQAQGQARGIEDLVRVGVERGLNRPAQWATITYCARLKRKPRPDEFETARKALRAIKEEQRV